MSYSFIWDMDGTLVDSYPAIVPAVQEACAEYGLSFTADYIHEAVIRTSVGAFLEEICYNDTRFEMIMLSALWVDRLQRTGVRNCGQEKGRSYGGGSFCACLRQDFWAECITFTRIDYTL